MCAQERKSRTTEDEKDVFFNIRLRREMHREICELAKRNERTVAAEIRIALRRHLDEAAKAAA